MDKVQNNVTRYLLQHKIQFELLSLGTADKHSATEVANILKVSPSLVYKTIVIKRTSNNGKKILAVIPAENSVDLKKAALALSEKKLVVPTQDEAEQLTGLLSGGISPLALINKGFETLIDCSAESLPAFIISAGERGLQICMSPMDLIKCVNARFATIIRDGI